MVQETTSSAADADEEGDETAINGLITELESVLVPKNLDENPALKSKINSDGSIHVDILADLKQIKKITSDKDLLLRAIGKSPRLNLDAAKCFVTPIYERKTLILREISSDTPKEEVEKIMESVDGWTCPEVVEIHADIGNNWFVTFNSEDDCLEAAMQLRLKGEFNGKKVAVRVKSQRMNIGASGAPSARPMTKSVTNWNSGAGYAGQFNPYTNGGTAGAPKVRGSPRRRSTQVQFQHSPFVAGYQDPIMDGPSSDYPGDFTRFTPASMVDIIRNAYQGKPPKKPDTLKNPQVKDMVRLRPQVHPLRLVRDAAGKPVLSSNSNEGMEAISVVT